MQKNRNGHAIAVICVALRLPPAYADAPMKSVRFRQVLHRGCQLRTAGQHNCQRHKPIWCPPPESNQRLFATLTNAKGVDSLPVASSIPSNQTARQYYHHCHEPIWCPPPESNWRPHPYQGCALPTELGGRKLNFKQQTLERVTGIEPASSAWKAGVLPLNYTRITACSARRIHDVRPAENVLVEGVGFEPT